MNVARTNLVTIRSYNILHRSFFLISLVVVAGRREHFGAVRRKASVTVLFRVLLCLAEIVIVVIVEESIFHFILGGFLRVLKQLLEREKDFWDGHAPLLVPLLRRHDCCHVDLSVGVDVGMHNAW